MKATASGKAGKGAALIRAAPLSQIRLRHPSSSQADRGWQNRYARPIKAAVAGVSVTVMITITKLGAQPTFTMSPKEKYLRLLE